MAHDSIAICAAADASPACLIVQLQHVGGRRDAPTLLQGREARLRLLLEQIPALLWTTDTELRFTSTLGRQLELLGLAPDEAVGVTLSDYFQTTDADFTAIVAHRRALAGESVTFQLE